MAQPIRLVTPMERTLFLKSLEPLRSLAPEDLVQIAHEAEERFFRKGERLYRLGEPVTKVHIITEGKVHVSGPDFESLTMGPGNPVGILTMLARSEVGVDAVAEQDTRTLMVKDEVLFNLFEDNFTILHNQILSLARRTLEQRRQIPDGTYLAPAEELQFKYKDNMDVVERLLFMRQGGGFQQQNMDALIHLTMHMEETRLEAGKTLWKAGDAAGFSYILLQGTVRCVLENGTHFRAGPGYPLGNIESQALAQRWYEAVTETPVVAFVARTDTFIDVLEDHFNMALDFLATLARNLMRILNDNHKAAQGDNEAA